MKRRTFLKSAAAAAGLAAVSSFPVPGYAKIKGANGKLNIAMVGVSGMQGNYHLQGTASENRYALCDVDSAALEAVGADNPGAKRFSDWRDMLDQVADQIDGVLITTPDHSHAPAAMAAMRRGLACYCEKPLAHNVAEIRLMQKMAAEKNVVTQMGTQIHSNDNYRRVVEKIQAGMIGKVTDVHVWVPVVWGGSPATNDDVAVPASLNWDLWIGCAPMRKYQPCYMGGNWRSFWDFGNGGMGDMGCHFMDLPFWALNLKYPKTIEAFHAEPADSDYAPSDLKVAYTFEQDGEPLTVTWYDGKLRPSMLAGLGLAKEPNGILFFGTEGALFANYGKNIYLPIGAEEPKVEVNAIPSSVGHHAEWFEAIKAGDPKGTLCNFDYSGKVAETILLGSVAYRTGKRLVYDAEKMEAVNAPEAGKFLAREYREGWGLDF